MMDRAAIKRAALLVAAAERIAADGEAALAEFINGWPMLVWAEEEAVLSGRALPPRLVTERAMYDRLRREAGDAVARSDPAAARRAVRDALGRAAGGP